MGSYVIAQWVQNALGIFWGVLPIVALKFVAGMAGIDVVIRGICSTLRDGLKVNYPAPPDL
jgi:hypothetical protein